MPERLRKIIGSGAIQRRVRGLAREISDRYAGERLLCVGVLKGACLFFADLVRRLDLEPEIDFVTLSSYGAGTSPNEAFRFDLDMRTGIAGRHVLIVEDIVDTGRSARFLLDRLAQRGPASLKLCAFLDKQERREAEVRIDFTGFVLAKGFVVGYGMDFAERYRMRNAVYEILFQP